VDQEAQRHAPIPVGRAILTSGGKTRFKAIIHAPTMERPAMRIDPQNVALATQAALALADSRGFTSVAIPGMGTGVGGVAHEAAASLMIKEIQQYTRHALQKVVLVDVDPAMVHAWQECLGVIGQ
jgi:O-acetyl-ADP-ribose deacetylase (regulator of RNase III)